VPAFNATLYGVVLEHVTDKVELESSGTEAEIGSMLLPKFSVVPVTLHELRIVAVTWNEPTAVADHDALLQTRAEHTMAALTNLDMVNSCNWLNRSVIDV